MAGPGRDPAGRTRVAILGGGPAALAAAFELTSTPELQARHDITVYQPGWRVGGKCASGRNKAESERIEEHGLHVWFGCYDNAFSIIRRCYAELRRNPQTDALATWDRAFKPCDDVIVWDRGTEWTPHPLRFPPNGLNPGMDVRRRTFADVVREVLGYLYRYEHDLAAEDDAVARVLGEITLDVGGWLGAACAEVGLEADRPEHAGVATLFEVVARVAEGVEQAGGGLDAGLARTVERLSDYGHRARQVDAALPGHAGVHFWAGTADVAIAAIRGVLADGLLWEGFDKANCEELSDWLERHGAHIDRDEPERNCPFLRGVYDGSFAFVDGDPLQPNMAAGRALQGAIRCFCHYSGSVLWRMQAGMGDAVIAPLYQVLRKRGVRFAFFHAVEELQPSADGRRVERITIVPQAGVRGEYEPLINVEYGRKKRLACWPDRPLFSQLVGGRTKRLREADFEHAVNPLASRARTTLVADTDFDVAILAVPPDVQKQICAPLLGASTGYAAMFAGAHTVITQAVQLWFDRTPAELGQPFPSNSLMSMYVEPLDTYCDMSHLLEAECWPPRKDVRHVAYLCGVIPHDEASDPVQAIASVRRRTQRFLECDAGRVWPKVATRPDGTGFEWQRLIAPPGLAGPARLDAQYLRVNHPATERYVLTLAGTVETRLWPSDRCFGNLVFAGDWTRNGFDAGCVEGAMTSGMLAAREICPALRHRHIAGLDGPSGFPNGPRRIDDGWPCAALGQGLDVAGRLAIWSGGRLRRLAAGRWR